MDYELQFTITFWIWIPSSSFINQKIKKRNSK